MCLGVQKSSTLRERLAFQSRLEWDGEVDTEYSRSFHTAASSLNGKRVCRGVLRTIE